MGEKTSISWTDHTMNPWIGCTKVSAGCDNCYAESLDHRWGHDSWGKGKPRRRTSVAYWADPLRWNALALGEFDRPARVFCASLADIMDDEAPSGAREDLWRLIDKTPNLIWQLLTKRPQRYETYLPADFKHGNVWLGITAEDQENYDLRWPILNKQATARSLLSFVSYEPALGPLDITGYGYAPDWIIFGGESGPNRRPCSRVWVDNLRDQISERFPSVKLFVKQMSARTPDEGKRLIPVDLRIQEFPA